MRRSIVATAPDQPPADVDGGDASAAAPLELVAAPAVEADAPPDAAGAALDDEPVPLAVEAADVALDEGAALEL
jgi:hypothetical protein